MKLTAQRLAAACFVAYIGLAFFTRGFYPVHSFGMFSATLPDQGNWVVVRAQDGTVHPITGAQALCCDVDWRAWTSSWRGKAVSERGDPKQWRLVAERRQACRVEDLDLPPNATLERQVVTFVPEGGVTLTSVPIQRCFARWNP